MKRVIFGGLVACLFWGAFAASEPTLLIRVERQTDTDLAALRAEGLPVVMELAPCLLVRGTALDLDRLRARGYRAGVLDAGAAVSDYFVMGLRPDSDVTAVRALGPIIAEEENWVLVKVPRATSFEPLFDAKVFATRVPLDPLEPPRPPPAAAGAGPWAAGAADDPADATDAGTSALAAARLPLGPSSSPSPQGTPHPIVQKIVASVTDADIDLFWQDLASNPPTGTRYSTAQGCRDAAAYCLDAYAGFDIPAEYQTWSPSHAPNVVATIEGAVRPENVFIVEGHLDDLPSSGVAPGADDNASGTVNVLASAKAMACWAFEDTVKFLNVTGEEFGLYGSDAYADDAFARDEKVQGVINMDMIGWAGNGVPAQENLDLNYNAASQWLAQRFVDAAATYGTGLSVDAFLCPSLTASDHYPFWQKGWSAVCGITDNEGYCGHGGNYPYYHTSSDTIPNCGNPAFFYSVVRASVATLAELAKPFKVTFDRPAVACGSTFGVLVGDRDLNASPTVQETLPVRVWSDTEPAGEWFTLGERGVDSMIFEASVPTTVAPPVGGDGVLSVTPGDAIHTEYTDALDCDGAVGVTYAATVQTDCVGPIIAGVGETGVTDTAATIVWTTDEAADSAVDWGETRPPGSTSSDAAVGTAHAIDLTGLQPCTVYYYRVRSSDPAGNVAVEDNGGDYFHFETLGDFGTGLQPCHEGRISLQQSPVSCADALPVEVIDLDLNLDPGVAETTTVTVTSSSETSPETLTLIETGPNTSTFAASIPTASGPAVASDGVLQVGGGDLVTATYRDDDDGTGSGAIAFATGDVDCSGPGLSSIRVTDITDGSVVVRWTSSEPSDSRVDWGPTAALGRVASDAALTTSHVLTLSPATECGRLYFRVSSTDAYGNTSIGDAAGAPFPVDVYRIPGLFRDTFESPAGWTLDGEWQIGAPEGRGSSPPDPAAAYEGSKVLGHDLTGLGAHPGDYEPQTTQRAISPVIDASTLVGGKIKFRRWLNTGGGGIASIEVKTGSVWTTVFATSGPIGLNETDWSLQTIDIAAFADGNAQLQVAFKQTGGFSSSANRSGWNVDRFIVKGSDTPDFVACGGCSGAPAFAGLASAEDLAACADTGVRLTWSSVAAWGTGAAGTYSVYRDASPSFVPSAANRIATGLTTTTYTDTSAPNGVLQYYIVRAENDETCSTGPANGGVTDANLVRRAATDAIAQPAPGEIGGTLRATAVNEAHVRLSWDAIPTAATYRIYRGPSPNGSFVQLAQTASTVWEDRDEMGTLTSRYYLVRAVDACGNEGP